jgi:protein-tyrosine phosphatase
MFSFLKRFEQKKRRDFSFIGTDMHSHLLPNIDDGCVDIGSSIKCIAKLKELGFSKIITTPHIMGGIYPNTPEQIKENLKELKLALAQEKIEIDLEVAAEYKVDELFMEYLEKDNLLSFGDNYILIEFSFVAPPVNLEEVIFKIQTKGYKPILAHPERYRYWTNNLEKLKEMKMLGCFFQLNLMSVVGQYGGEVKEQSKKIIKEGMVDFLGTDLHRPDDLKVLEKLVNADGEMKKLLELHILNGQL